MSFIPPGEHYPRGETKESVVTQTGRPGSDSRFCHGFVGWFLTLVFLSFRFLVCKRRLIMSTTLEDCKGPQGWLMRSYVTDHEVVLACRFCGHVRNGTWWWLPITGCCVCPVGISGISRGTVCILDLRC